jgi:hypothetical protein
MTKHSCIAIAALALGVALASSAFAQNGPGAINYGAGSSPQTGGAAAQPTATTGRGTYDVAPSSDSQNGPAGPGGQYFSAGTSPQTGNKPLPTSASGAGAPQPTTQTAGPAGPAGANFGGGSNPQTGR